MSPFNPTEINDAYNEDRVESIARYLKVEPEAISCLLPTFDHGDEDVLDAMELLGIEDIPALVAYLAGEYTDDERVEFEEAV